MIINELSESRPSGKKNKSGAQTNLKYISVFSLFTVIPSLIVAIFSLFIFNFGIQNYFDKQITKAVNNSYDVAKNYLEESKENVLSDVILMSVGLNRASGFYYSNPNRFKQIIRSEKFLRRIDKNRALDNFLGIPPPSSNTIPQPNITPDSESTHTGPPLQSVDCISSTIPSTVQFIYNLTVIVPSIIEQNSKTNKLQDSLYSIKGAGQNCYEFTLELN